MMAANPFAEDAHDYSPLPREVFCVLLEVRVHAETHGAQLYRMLAQLERLDARVATLERGSAERGSASARARIEPAATARERALTLLDLSADALG